MSSNRVHVHSAGSHQCNNCGEEALKSAAEKKARLARIRRGATAGATPEEASRGGKVALKTKVIGGGTLSTGDGAGKIGGVGVTGKASTAKVVSFSVKSNLGKVRLGTSIPRGHYLYGRKGGGGSGHRPPIKASPRVETTPRPSTVPCDLIITSPRKAPAQTPRTGAKSSEGYLESENRVVAEEDDQENLPDEDLFIPAKSIVNPNDLNNDELRFLFKYGVRLPVLSSNAAGGTKHGQLALVHIDDECQAPPPTPPPASVDEHYLIHKHFLSQLPEAHLLYDNQDIDLDSLCEPVGQETVISEISLGPEKPSTHLQHCHHHNMSLTGMHRESGGGAAGMVKGRSMTSHSGGSQSSALSKLTAYSWRRQDDEKKLPQVTDDLFYRATHASVEARAHFNRSQGSGNRFGLTKAAMANCGFCQKTRNTSDSEDETSNLSTGAFRTRQLARRINELEGMQPAKSMGNHRSAKAGVAARAQLLPQDKKRQLTASSDNILYNQVRQSIDWLNVPRDKQSHIAIMGRCLSPAKSGSQATGLTRALLEGKDHKSAQTYLDYVENVRNTIRQASRQKRRDGSTASQSSHKLSVKMNGVNRDAVESVFDCNRPGGRPVEYEEQELSASFVDDASGVDLTGLSKRPSQEDDPLLVNGVILESRPPPNSPKDGAEDVGFNGMHTVGRRSMLRVDLRRATQVS